MKKYFQYDVTEDGRVFLDGKELKQHDNGRGYLVVFICINNKFTSKAIHRLLGELYIDNPNNKSDVDHINGNRRDNRLENLRWVSHGENIKHSYDLNKRSARGENNSRAILKEEEVHDICYLLSLGYSSACIRDMGFPYVITSTIKSRRNWKYISKHYSF